MVERVHEHSPKRLRQRTQDRSSATASRGGPHRRLADQGRLRVALFAGGAGAGKAMLHVAWLDRSANGDGPVALARKGQQGGLGQSEKDSGKLPLRWAIPAATRACGRRYVEDTLVALLAAP